MFAGPVQLFTTRDVYNFLIVTTILGLPGMFNLDYLAKKSALNKLRSDPQFNSTAANKVREETWVKKVANARTRIFASIILIGILVLIVIVSKLI